MAKKIMSVGFNCLEPAIENIFFSSDRSLHDSDIIIFSPERYCFANLRNSKHRGLHLLDEDESHDVVKRYTHWQTELTEALKLGKTVFVFLVKPVSFYIQDVLKDSKSDLDYSLNSMKKVLLSNYATLPLKINNLESKEGREIRVANDPKFLANYWEKFAEHSYYEAFYDSAPDLVIFKTKTGDKAVGGIIPKYKGHLILLPVVSFESYGEEIDDNDGWSKRALILGKNFLTCILEIDKAIKTTGDATPQPEWVKNATFISTKEQSLLSEVYEIDKQLDELKIKKEQLLQTIDQEGQLRWLLYEKGAQLEEAILQTLRLLGFEAENYNEDNSEFDAVFTSPEGRFLGEAEGKDTKAINIDKFSQLERNINEDAKREEVDDFAKGVLFGNAFRLSPLNERGDFFTRKCAQGAQRTGVALIRTPDLFELALYLKENEDRDFARECREAIYETKGEIVSFPAIPNETNP